MSDTSPNFQKTSNQNIDYLKILKIVWSRWYWIAICMLISLFLTYIYLWYTPKIFSTTASLKFAEEKTEITELLAVKNLYDRTNKVQAETYVIQSKDVLLNAISRIDYKVSYFVKGRIRTTDLYPEKPFPIDIISQDSTSFYKGYLEVKPLDQERYTLTYQNVTRTYPFGAQVAIPGIRFRLKKGAHANDSEYLIKFNNKEDFLGQVAGGLTMREAAKSSNVLLLNFTNRNPFFARDILNAILKEYIYYDGYRRSISASQTISFIDEQLNFLATQVRASGTALESFKRSKKMFDIESLAANRSNRVIDQEDEAKALDLEELAINQLYERINSDAANSDFNYKIDGDINSLLISLIGQLNQFILDRNKLLVTLNPNAEPVRSIDRQIANVKKAIMNNIESTRERISRVRRYLNKQMSSAETKLAELPSTERNLMNLQADYDINQKVFSYLFEKKLEAQITKAAVVSGASVVDFANSGGSLVSPIPQRAYTYAVIWGLGAGILLILLVRLTNPYIYDKETVEHLTSIPIIGIIRKFPGFIDNDNRQILSLEKPKSIFAESVRSVRTNLSFLAGEKKSKVICITSEIAGEGKSFVALNLASTLALIEKKVVLIGADLRKSKLHRTFHTENKVGLSTLLARNSTLQEVLIETDNPNLSFIPSGPVPPNPSELLHTTRMRELITELSEVYDFVLIDTAPVGLVSDSIPLIRQADINLFVIRSGVSRYNSANIPERLAGEYNLSNVVIVLNAFTEDVFHSRFYTTTASGGAYQYYYSDYSGYAGDGYFEDDKRKKWWSFSRWFSKKSS